MCDTVAMILVEGAQAADVRELAVTARGVPILAALEQSDSDRVIIYTGVARIVYHGTGFGEQLRAITRELCARKRGPKKRVVQERLMMEKAA